MNKKRTIFSGAACALLLLLAFNVVSGYGLRGARLDLTAEGLYTLSPGTDLILDGLHEAVHLELYWSETSGSEIPQFRTYAQRVREFLEELVRRSNGMLQLTLRDPEPFSEAEDDATAAQVASVSVSASGNKLVLGLVGTNSVDEQEVIPFFSPDKEAFLEYEVARMIHQLSSVAKPKVVLVTSLPMDAQFDPQNPGQQSQSWQALEQLRDLREVEVLPAGAEALPESMDLLLLVHPKELSEPLLRSVDQYALGGGAIVAFLDPFCEADETARADPFSGRPPAGKPNSDLGPLLAAWGVALDSANICGDAQYAQRVNTGGRGGLEVIDYLPWLGLPADSMIAEDPIVGGLDQINMATAGWFVGLEGASTKLQALIVSSDQAGPIVAAQLAMFPDPNSILRNFVPSGDAYTLAARLTGTLRTAFPAGEGEIPAEGWLNEGQAGGILLVADADMLQDSFWITEQRLGPISLGWRMMADNGSFLLNAVETLSGSSALASLRGRGNAQRPFTRVKALQQGAEKKYLAREQQLQDEIRASEARIMELQRESGEALILSPQAGAELQKIQAQMLEARKELRQVRHGLTKDIESLGSRVMILNTVLMPLLVAILTAWWVSRRAGQRRKVA